MKSTILTLLFICFLSVLSSAKDQLRLSGSKDPISDISERVIVSAYRQIGIEVEILKFPAERALNWSNKGKTDGEVNRIKGIEKLYPNLVMVAAPVNYFEGMAFSANIDIPVKNWDSIKPFSIAIRIGAKFAEIGTTGMKVSSFPSYQKVFELVGRGRYDIAIASRLTGLYHIKAQQLTHLAILEPPLLKFKLYHYLHKKHRSLVPKITDSLLKMNQQGAIEQIRDAYIKELRLN